MADNNNLPQLTEQLANLNGQPQKVSPVDYIYNSIKSKAADPSLLERIDSVKDDADYFSNIFASTQDPKISFNEDKININEAYSQLSDGSYITRYDEGFIKGADNERLYAEQQSTGSKWANGLGKFLGKTGVNVVGGVLGTAYGAVSAIAEGNWERIYDNEFYDFLDDQNTKMDNFAANYRTQEENDMGFFSSMGTANFWADDFLGGLSFMTGTIISESIWAAATGGTSLTTTAARTGLRASKYFNTAKALTKGVKDAQKVARQYNRLSSIKRATDLSVKYGKAGEILNLARFTYTGAGFEAGMEARLYEKEQRENFNRDFEELNGRKPTAMEVADFENTLGNTSNALWATNMALVGTSNLAILGKTFGVSSPFRLPGKRLNRAVFGVGERSTFGEAGQRVATEAVKRNKIQKTLGFGKAVLKAPFYEGFVEEGGQAASSSAMEGYLTSRYNPSEDVMGVAESIYEGLSHTYGSKEGWKEVGLGALIGLVGGEGSKVASGQGFFREARAALKDQDEASVQKAEEMDKNLGTKVADRIFASKLEENLAHATELQNAQEEYDAAEDQGSVMGMANAQSKIMLTSVKNAVDFDYLDDQIQDFEAGLRVQDPAKIADHFGIEESQVDAKIDELVQEYRDLGDSYKSAKEFADYIISDNPKELFENGQPIDVRVARAAIAYQMVMTDVMEKNMDGAHAAIIESLNELNPQLSAKYMQALNRFNQINKSKKEDVQALAKSENRLKLKRQQLDSLNKRLLKADQIKSQADTEGNQKSADKYNKLVNKIAEVQEEVIALEADVREKNGKLAQQREEMSQINAATRALANQLDMADPLAGDDLVDQITLEDTQASLEELDQTLQGLKQTNPRLVQRILKLGQEYNKGLEMWQRNADTLQDLADPELGLKRVGTMMQKKKTAGETTLQFLERLQRTQAEDLEFSTRIDELVNQSQEDDTEDEAPSDGATDGVVDGAEVNEQEAAEQNPGEDITQEEEGIAPVDSVQSKIAELQQLLKDLVGKNRFVLDNFTDDTQQLQEEEAPTQEELDEYNQIRRDFKAGDINKLVGRPIDQISARIKERSGLTDAQIQRYQDLSQKMLDWRIVTGTNADGISIQDILNQIEAYRQELKQTDTQVSAEQVLEMAEQGQSEFTVDTANPDFVNSMDKVNIKQDKIQTTISHVDIETVIESDFNVKYLRDENVGTTENPSMVSVYELERDGEVFNINYTHDHHRIVIPKKDTKAFLDGMNMQTVKYNTKTGWGYVFRDGVPMESDFGINLINNPEVNILNPQLIYELQPGDKASFVVNMQDVYNNEAILPLIETGNLEAAKKLMSIYVVNKDGDVIGFLKSGATANESNFNKVRDEAFSALQKKLENTEVSLEDLAEDNTNSVINLPFEVEVEKTFVGTPNIELNPDRSTKVFKITEEQSELITSFGYAKNGKLEGKDEGARMTFIPKDKNTPYVIIQHGNTPVAFPVGLTPTASNLQQQVLDILNSDMREQDKLVEVINLLKQNGVEAADYNLDALRDNTSELNRLLRSLDGSTRTYSEEELSSMSKEEFLQAAEIVINLDKPAFVSPKVKISLSKKLTDTRIRKATATKKLTESERQDLIIKNLVYTSQAESRKDVKRLVMETGDEIFIKEFMENKSFRDQVVESSLANKVVPSIQTDATVESLIEDLIDMEYNDIPLDIKEQFENDVIDLKLNPHRSKIKALARKIKKSLENRYKLVEASVNTNNMYHIPTSENEAQMFEQGYVKVVGDFYKKIDRSQDLQTVLEGLYNKYNNNTLPNHIQFEGGMSFDEFVQAMPNTLLDVYKLYYNTQEAVPVSRKAAMVGNEQYLREDFKGDFAKFIQQEKAKGSELYKNVLQHFQITDKGILKDDILSRDKIDDYQTELGANYSALLNYSLINKHIDLQAQPQNIIFVEDVDNINRREAVNNPNLPKPKTKATILDDNTISFAKVNKPFIEYKGSVYEQVFSNKQGEYAYERIADIDPNFMVTEVTAPFSKLPIETNKEIDETKSNINRTDGRKIDC